MLPPNRGDDDLHVGQYQPQVCVTRIAGRAGQVVVPQLVDEFGAALLRYLSHDRAWKHLRAENGRDARLPDLVYQLGHLSGRGFREVGGLHRANDLEPVSGAKVGEGVVVGQQLPVLLGDGGNRLGYSPVKVLNALRERGQVGVVVAGVVRVEGGQTHL